MGIDKRKNYLAVMLILAIMLVMGWRQVAAASDFSIPVSQNVIDAAAMGIGPGDVVCLEPGVRDQPQYWQNFKGTEEEPIIIKNCGGQVVINVPLNGNNERQGNGILVTKSSHIQITGSGDQGFEYGIDIAGAVMGIAVTGLSKKDIEVDHLSVHDVGFAGIIVKTDPNCDPATWRANFVMKDVRIHDNYVYHTEDGEGFYLGFTFVGGYDINCDGQTITVYGHLIKNMEVYNNRTEDTGSEGIQVGSSPFARIHDNIVIDPGQRPFADYQNNGMQVNYQDAIIYNNWIQNAPANGLILFGTGYQVFNNIIISSGESATYVDDRTDPRQPGHGIVFANNTIITPGGDGFRMAYTDISGTAVVKNNIIAAPGDSYFAKVYNTSVVDESNNIYVPTVEEVGFVDPVAFDYHLTDVSTAINAGIDVKHPNVNFDYDWNDRPQGLNPDAGVFEWLPTAAGELTELAQNGGFESSEEDKSPTGWKVKAGGNGRVVCNKVDRPGKPDKIFAYEGLCAYQIKAGANGGKTKISQVLDAVTVPAGSTLRLEAYFNGQKLGDGSVRLTAKVFYSGDVTESYKISALNGTYDYTEASNLFTVSQDVVSIKIQLQFVGSAGKVTVDQVSLGVYGAAGVLPLPLSESASLSAGSSLITTEKQSQLSQ
ncbi:MAG TPA: right-handed parallel beta-helix repeat-containing protein, partial [Phototrophicaceae bacterium]|nr:right-handed parallel beta-helix repeat-containing protein [Phototrophicaceae bacterium]